MSADERTRHPSVAHVLRFFVTEAEWKEEEMREETYMRQRAAAQARKIQLSMDRKRGRVTGRSPRDRALMSETVEVESEYDPKRW